MRASLVFAVAVLILCRCGLEPLSGGTTDTDNIRISAVMYQSDGKFAAGASVMLRSADYLSAIDEDTIDNNEKRKTVTDENGRFCFDSLDSGSYSIEINDERESAFLFRITTGNVNEHGSDMVLSDTLKPYAKVRGNVDISTSAAPLYCLVYGLERKVLVDSSGNFELGNLPEGVYSFKIISEDDAFKPVVINDIHASSVSETRLPFVNWNSSKKLFLNTSAAGADISGQVTEFPVLIRLNDSNFSFDSSAADGSDIRFTNSKGVLLSHEIESWDKSARSAQIWVKVDTIKGNDSTQHIMILWGNSNDVNLSKSSDVFDTANGFQGVWHFSDFKGNETFDATLNMFNGTTTEVYGVSGLIGSSGEFNGLTSNVLISGTADGKMNFAENAYYTISAWVYTYENDTSYFIAGKGDYQYNLKIKDQQWCFALYTGQSSNVLELRDSISERYKWRLLTGVRKGNRQYLYINDECVDSTGKIISGDPTENTNHDFQIGAGSELTSTGFKTFYGKMDEVRISNVSRGPNWIKLSYMNQKEVDKLVQFK
ncbi:MAG: DUF2341 domain-containing protein [Fibrobacter sp.]|nr:DUF2341 domain-containing protein [Fibrobacter sp.]